MATHFSPPSKAQADEKKVRALIENRERRIEKEIERRGLSKTRQITVLAPKMRRKSKKDIEFKSYEQKKSEAEAEAEAEQQQQQQQQQQRYVPSFREISNLPHQSDTERPEEELRYVQTIYDIMSLPITKEDRKEFIQALRKNVHVSGYVGALTSKLSALVLYFGTGFGCLFGYLQTLHQFREKKSIKNTPTTGGTTTAANDVSSSTNGQQANTTTQDPASSGLSGMVLSNTGGGNTVL